MNFGAGPLSVRENRLINQSMRLAYVFRVLLAVPPIENKIYLVTEINFEDKKVTTLFRGFLHNYYDFDELTLLQFTGFQDNDKNEVYHFDLLKKGNSTFKIELDKDIAGFIGLDISISQKTNRSILDLIADGYLVEGNALIV